MVAQIGKLGRVPDIKQPASFHCREDRAEAFAIAAGVADLHDPRGFLMRRCTGHIDQADIIHGTVVPVCWRFRVLTIQTAGRLGPGDATENGPDGHADPGKIALSENIAGHDLAGGKEIG